MYNISPIANGTRLRADHNTFADVIASYNAGVTLSGDDIWTAPADGPEVKAGDQWLHVTNLGGSPLQTPGWTAIVHKGVPFSTRLPDTPETPPIPHPKIEINNSYINYRSNGIEMTQRMIPDGPPTAGWYPIPI